MEQDVLQVCQPCVEAAMKFGIMDWLGLGFLCILGLISFFTRHNLFSMSKGSWQLVKNVIESIKSKKLG